MLRAMKHTSAFLLRDRLVTQALRHTSLMASIIFPIVWQRCSQLRHGTYRPAIDQGRWHGTFWSLIGRFSQKRTRIVEIGVVELILRSQMGPRLPNGSCFVGHLLEKQGLQHVIAALPLIAELSSDVDLVVIGSGPYQAALAEMAHNVELRMREIHGIHRRRGRSLATSQFRFHWPCNVS